MAFDGTRDYSPNANESYQLVTIEGNTRYVTMQLIEPWSPEVFAYARVTVDDQTPPTGKGLKLSSQTRDAVIELDLVKAFPGVGSSEAGGRALWIDPQAEIELFLSYDDA